MTSIEKIAELFAVAVGQGKFQFADGMQFADFAAWAHYCATAAGVDNPVGVFTRGLSHRDNFGKGWREKLRTIDRQWAGEQLKKRLPPRVMAQLQQAVERAAEDSPHRRERIASATGLDRIFRDRSTGSRDGKKWARVLREKAAQEQREAAK